MIHFNNYCTLTLKCCFFIFLFFIFYHTLFFNLIVPNFFPLYIAFFYLKIYELYNEFTNLLMFYGLFYHFYCFLFNGIKKMRTNGVNETSYWFLKVAYRLGWTIIYIYNSILWLGSVSIYSFWVGISRFFLFLFLSFFFFCWKNNMNFII